MRTSFREKKDHKQYLKDGKWVDTGKNDIVLLWDTWMYSKDIVAQFRDEQGYMNFLYKEDVEVVKSLMDGEL